MTNAQFFGTGKFRPLLHKKKIVRIESTSILQMKKLTAHPVLVPGFPGPKSKVFSSIPQIFMDSDYGQRTVLGAGDTTMRKRLHVSEFLNFGKFQVPLQRDTCL